MRSCKSKKDKHYNYQKKKEKRTNNEVLKLHRKLHISIRIPQKENESVLMFSWREGCFRSTSWTHRVTAILFGDYNFSTLHTSRTHDCHFMKYYIENTSLTLVCENCWSKIFDPSQLYKRKTKYLFLDWINVSIFYFFQKEIKILVISVFLEVWFVQLL